MSTTQAQSFDLGPSIKTVGETSTFSPNADDLYEWESIPVEVRFDRDHDNLLDVEDVTDAQRARLLEEYLDALSEVCPEHGVCEADSNGPSESEIPSEPRLMPLKDSGKESAIVGQCRLDSDEARSLLHDPREAINAIANGHRGFCLYAGKESHNTANILFADHDDMDVFPRSTLPETLTVRSGSGGEHETFVYDGDIPLGDGKGKYKGGGEMRGHNQYCVVPGSVHPSGGVYHVIADSDIATLQNTDIPKGFYKSSYNNSTTETDVDIDVGATNVGTTNERGYTLTECRERDDELDTLLSTPIREDLDSKVHDDSDIDAELVWRLRYHHFSPQQITSIWKTHRSRTKLGRTDYIPRTIRKCATHDDRWVYRVDTERVADHVGFIPNVGPKNKSPWNYDGLQQKDVWNRTTRTIERALNEGAYTVIGGLPSAGKSTGLIKAAATTGVPITVLTSRHDLYDDYRERCDDHDLSCKELPSFHNDCPTADGEHGSEWEQTVRRAYRRGLSGKEIHAYDEQLFGEPLPCDDGHECSYKQNWDFDPDEYDVLIGNYVHGYNSNMTANRTVVFDEFPQSSFVEEFDMEEVFSIVSNFLQQHEEIPFDNHTDVLEYRSDDERRQKAEQWFCDRDGGLERDTTGIINDALGESPSRNRDAQWNEFQHTVNHPLAPLLTYALINGHDLGNGWEYSDLELGFAREHGRLADCVAVRNRGAIEKEHSKLFVLRPPQLTEADGVICLDGTPELELWQTVVDHDLSKQQVLSDDERCEYLTNVLGMTLVQTTERANHYASGNYVHPEQDGVLFDSVRRETGVQPSLISTKAAVAKYDETDVLTPIDDVRGVEECRESTNVEWYGNLKGTNKFSDERVGIVSGSTHFGDDHVKKWCAFNGESTEHVSGTTGIDREYTTELGNTVQRNMRDNNVFQAIMRFERGTGSGALVFVHTAAFPDWVPVEHEGSVEKLSDGMKEVITAIDRCDGTTFKTNDITERVGRSKSQVQRNLNELGEWEQLDCEKKPGQATKWTVNDGFHETFVDETEYVVEDHSSTEGE
jgi:hypothetical protein